MTVVDCLKKTCRHAVLCQAQEEGFCLARYNQERHQEYRKRRAEAKEGEKAEEEVAPST